MVSTRAATALAMDARVEELERRIDNQGRMLETISQQLSLLLADRRSTPSRDRSPGMRSEQVGRRSRRAQQSLDQAPKKDWADDRWGNNHTLRGLEVGRKLELPVCEDAYGWLTKVERFFRVNGVEDYDKMELVLVALEGEALIWY